MSSVDAAVDGKRVLIVDDDPVIRAVAGQSLEAMGLVIEEAEDGALALAAIDIGTGPGQ